MRWWAGCFIRELPPLTVEAPGVWHICGTSHRMAPVQAVARGQRSGLLATAGGAILDETFHPWRGMAIAVHRGDYVVDGALQVGRSTGACAGARPGSLERGAR
jgi:hypothetical protein